MNEHKHNEFCEEYGCEQMKYNKCPDCSHPADHWGGGTCPKKGCWCVNESGGNEMSSFGAGVNAKEPPPKKNNTKPLWETVIEDMEERNKIGEERYGVKLQKFNGRNALKDAYQEKLDETVYYKQWMEERKELVNVLKEVLNSNAPMEMSDELYFKIENLLKSLGEL